MQISFRLEVIKSYSNKRKTCSWDGNGKEFFLSAADWYWNTVIFFRLTSLESISSCFTHPTFIWLLAAYSILTWGFVLSLFWKLNIIHTNVSNLSSMNSFRVLFKNLSADLSFIRDQAFNLEDIVRNCWK